MFFDGCPNPLHVDASRGVATKTRNAPRESDCVNGAAARAPARGRAGTPPAGRVILAHQPSGGLTHVDAAHLRQGIVGADWARCDHLGRIPAHLLARR